MPDVELKNEYSEIWSNLTKVRERGRLGHAYLFIGDESYTLTRFARLWLQSFLCSQLQEGGQPCYECVSCRQFRHGNHPRFQLLQPKSKSRQIIVDEVREFERILHLTSSGESYKLGLVQEADRLNEQAQNALLKTLEEPPRKTLLLLTTISPKLLLPTIRSRCQFVSLLKNQRSYQFAIANGLLPVLARMKPGAGAAVALKSAAQLGKIFAKLKKEAEHAVDETENELESEMIGENPKLQKRLAEIKEARIAAEYRRLRNQITEAVQTWYGQEELRAHGVPTTLLPHPELLAAAVEEDNKKTYPAEIDSERVDKTTAASHRLARMMAGNMDEKLALQAFCLELCEKS